MRFVVVLMLLAAPTWADPAPLPAPTAAPAGSPPSMTAPVTVPTPAAAAAAAASSMQDDSPACACRRRRAKIIAASAVGSMYGAYAIWSYFAWYRGRSQAFKFEKEKNGGLSFREYSGGADKFGHAWSNYTLTRATTAALVAGGWKRRSSSFVAGALTEVAFTLTEIQDGFYPYGFSTRDMVANVSGMSLALVMENFPAVDRLLDYKVQYFPSYDYRYQFRHNNSVDVGQDYTGQSYLLSLHLGALPHAMDSEYTRWTQFVDLSVGFEAHNYSPKSQDMTPRVQTQFVGLTLNMQGVLSALLPESRARRIGRGIFEVYALPYTTLRAYQFSRHPD